MSTPDKEVRAALAEWLEAFNTKDLDRFTTLYDPDVVYANAHAPLRRGVTPVVEAFAPAFENESSRIEFTEETLFVTADMALISGSFRAGSAQPDGSLTDVNGGRVALLYRRAADGRWLLCFDMDNTPPDAAV